MRTLCIAIGCIHQTEIMRCSLHVVRARWLCARGLLSLHRPAPPTPATAAAAVANGCRGGTCGLTSSPFCFERSQCRQPLHRQRLFLSSAAPQQLASTEDAEGSGTASNAAPGFGGTAPTLDDPAVTSYLNRVLAHRKELQQLIVRLAEVGANLSRGGGGHFN